MFFILRKASKDLAGEWGFKKYLLYSLGEILLVMIGILLAIQVENWNENRQERTLEINLLNALQQTIKEDIQSIKKRIKTNESAKDACQIVLNHFEKQLPYCDTLVMHFSKIESGWLTFLKTNAFENAKRYGLNFIQNDSTRLMLTDLYVEQLDWVAKVQHRRDLYYYHIVAPFITEHFESLSFNGMIPNDFESLRENPKYKNILRTTKEHLGRRIVTQKRILRTLKTINNRLEREH